MNKKPSPIGHHFLRAMIAWFNENNIKPIHIQVWAKPIANAAIQANLSPDGLIIFNIHHEAVRDLIVDEQGVSFKARFSGVEHQLFIPLNYILNVSIPVDAENNLIYPLSVPNTDVMYVSMTGKERPKDTPPQELESRPQLAVVK